MMKELGIYNKENQRIFTVIKPGFLHLAKNIIEIFNKNGWEVSKLRTKQLLRKEANKLYAVHKKESFYNDLCKYMSSGPSLAIIFTRDKLNNDKIYKEVSEIKDKIRKKWGESEMRNVLHSSDSYEHMLKEMSIYF